MSIIEKQIKDLRYIMGNLTDGKIPNDYQNIIENVIDTIQSLSAKLQAKNNDGWIPVDERLPVPLTKVLITYKTYDGERVCEGRYNGKWYDCETRTILNAIAWQPLPEPYVPNERTEIIGENEP